jgi:hypothetical protein
MSGPLSSGLEAVLAALLVLGNLLAVPVWLWLIGGSFAGGRRLLAQLGRPPAAGQGAGKRNSLRL